MQYLVFLASLLASAVTPQEYDFERAASHSFILAACVPADDASQSGPWVGDASPLPLPAVLLAAGRFSLRTAGRRAQETEIEGTSAKVRTAPPAPWRRFKLPRWLFSAFIAVMLLGMAPAFAAQPLAGAATSNPAEVDSEAEAGGDVDRGTAAQSVGHRRHKTEQEESSEGENGFPRRPFFGMPNVVVNDPADYPRPECLENNDPGSFFYSMRPNIFNVPIPAEWDFYNIINTDRPDFTDAVYSVGKGVTYLETGFTYTKINTADLHINTRQLPESLLRHGITDEFELRLKWPGYLMDNVIDPHSTLRQSTFGAEDIDAGFKWELLQQKSWRPMTTLVAGMTLPTGAQGTSANYVQPHFNILFGWGIRRWLYIKQQIGCDFVHSSSTQIVTPLVGASTPTFVSVRSPPNSWHESISILTQWSKRVGAFHEWFMISPTGGGHSPAQHFLDMGLYLYATPNVQFDVRVGRQISNQVDYYFTGAGFSGRW